MSMKDKALELASEVVRRLSPEFDDVAALVYSRDQMMVKLWNTQPSVVQSWIDTYLGVYVAKDKRVLAIELSVQDPAKVEEVVKAVKAKLAALEESELYAPLPKPSPYEPVQQVMDPGILRGIEDPGWVTKALIESAEGAGAERVAGTARLARVARALATSAGFEGAEEGTEAEVYLRVFKGGFSGHWAFGATKLEEADLRRVGETAAAFATASKAEAGFEPGRYDVIISPLVAGNLLAQVARSASAGSMIMGFSMFMQNKPGDVVASEKLTIEDVPRDTEIAGISFDDEGVPTRDKPIIEKGVLRNILHNTATAKKMGAESTGNAGWVFPHPWALRVSPGDMADAGIDDLAKELGNGIIINNNWYTRFQSYVEGIFSTVTRDAALVVKNGEVVGTITTRIRIAGKMIELLKNIDAVGRTVHKVRWWEVRLPTKAPYLLIRNVSLTKPFA